MAFADDQSNTNSGDPGQQQGDNPTDQQGNSPAPEQGGKPNGDCPQADPSQSVFMIVGDRAYRSQEDVVNKISHADQHIATLENERKTDKAEIERLQAENARLSKIVDNMPGTGSGNDLSGNGSQTENLSIDEIVQKTASMVTNLQQEEAQRTQQENNLAACEQKAQELYGDSYKDTIRQRGQELGMSGAQIDALGKDSPSAFSRLFLDNQDVSSPAPSHGSGADVNTAAMQHQQGRGNDPKPVNIVKMRERDRISTVFERMKANGINY